MPSIVPIVEGDGEVTALPELLRRLLYEDFLVYDWKILRPKNAHGCGNLTAPNGIERFVRYALLEPECDGIFILIDRDAVLGLPESEQPAEGCVPAFAQILAERVARLKPSVPVVIVIASWEYETWFLASIETIIPSLGPYEGDVEALRSPKGWIDKHLRSTQGRVYRETSDQVKMTHKLDLELLMNHRNTGFLLKIGRSSASAYMFACSRPFCASIAVRLASTTAKGKPSSPQST